MQLKFWGAGKTGRNAYDVGLLKLALDVTRAEYGPYQITVVDQTFGTTRGRRELSKGKLINIYASPIRPTHVLATERIRSVPFPIMRGLLGYRSLIIAGSRRADFDTVVDLDSLRRFSIGQASGWIDADIFRHNSVRVVQDSKYQNLFSMLERERFDAISLGVSEAPIALARVSDLHPTLSLYDDLVVYYPFATTYQLSWHDTRLAQRIEMGLKKLEKSGQFDKFFEENFSERLSELRNKGARVIVLRNPDVDPSFGINQPVLLAEPGADLNRL